MRLVKIDDHFETQLAHTLRNICSEDDSPNFYDVYTSQIRGDVTNVLLYREDDLIQTIIFVAERDGWFRAECQPSPCFLLLRLLKDRKVRIYGGALLCPEEMYLNKPVSEA